jgi:hypothetical protein
VQRLARGATRVWGEGRKERGAFGRRSFDARCCLMQGRKNDLVSGGG